MRLPRFRPGASLRKASRQVKQRDGRLWGGDHQRCDRHPVAPRRVIHRNGCFYGVSASNALTSSRAAAASSRSSAGWTCTASFIRRPPRSAAAVAAYAPPQSAPYHAHPTRRGEPKPTSPGDQTSELPTIAPRTRRYARSRATAADRRQIFCPFSQRIQRLRWNSDSVSPGSNPGSPARKFQIKSYSYDGKRTLGRDDACRAVSRPIQLISKA